MTLVLEESLKVRREIAEAKREIIRLVIILNSEIGWKKWINRFDMLSKIEKLTIYKLKKIYHKENM